MNRKFDIILFGATGFTGKLVAEYLSKHANTENISWAIAGRDTEKLIAVSNTLSENKPAIITADINDVISLRNMVSQTKILMNTVGPFNIYGKDVVTSCIESGTHYLDITGEPSFVADLYNNHFQSAANYKACRLILLRG